MFAVIETGSKQYLVQSDQKLEIEKVVLQNRFVNETLNSKEIKDLSIALKEIESDLNQKSDQWLEFSILLEE